MFKEIKGQSLWIRYIKDRTSSRKKKHFAGFIGGYMGSGKTYSGLSMSEEYDDNFTSEKYILSAKELLRILKDDSYAKSLGIKKGKSSIVYDETSVSYSSKDALSITGKMLDAVLSTMRNKRYCLWIISPYKTMIGKTGRTLLTAEFKTMSINYITKVSKLRGYLINYNPDKDRFYKPYLAMRSNEGRIKVIRDVYVSLPSKKLRNECDKKKEEFQNQIYNKYYDIFDSIEKKESFEVNKWTGVGQTPQSIEIKKPLTKVQDDFVKYVNQGNSLSDASKHFGFERARASALKKQIQKKGHKLEGYS